MKWTFFGLLINGFLYADFPLYLILLFYGWERQEGKNKFNQKTVEITAWLILALCHFPSCPLHEISKSKLTFLSRCRLYYLPLGFSPLATNKNVAFHRYINLQKDATRLVLCPFMDVETMTQWLNNLFKVQQVSGRASLIPKLEFSVRGREVWWGMLPQTLDFSVPFQGFPENSGHLSHTCIKFIKHFLIHFWFFTIMLWLGVG